MEWRPMAEPDLPAVKDLADAIHKTYLEDDVVFAERLRLYPMGCFVLMMGNIVAGYSIAHPWRRGTTPALNSLLGSLPLTPDTLYWHDLALSLSARGKHAANPVITLLDHVARGSGLFGISLTAVSGSVGFWEKHGFHRIEKAHRTQELESYGSNACPMFRPIVAYSQDLEMAVPPLSH